jgi:G3E family GTPase
MIDILLLSGFLGAGKTTLLGRILRWEIALSGTVVIVNEFGKVGIDGALLENAGTDVVELASGCICCSLKNDLRISLMNVKERFHPKRIILEASGVADPAAIQSLLREPALCESMRIAKTVTVFDAEYWDVREVFGPLFMNQLVSADLILLNKIDLLDKGDVGRILDQMHSALPDAKIVPTLHCGIDPETLWEVGTALESAPPQPFFFPMLRSPSATENHEGKTGTGKHVDASGYVTFSFQSEQILNEQQFKRVITGLPPEAFRVKGFVRFPDRTEILNHVGGKSEWSPCNGKKETTLVFIGWDMKGDEILLKLGECVSKKKPVRERPNRKTGGSLLVR